MNVGRVGDEMVVVRFGERCEAIIDEEVKDVRISDGKTAIAKLVFDERWNLQAILVNDIYVWTRERGLR